MRRLLANIVFGVEVAVFGVVCLVCSPVLLVRFGVHCGQGLIAARWPDSDRARAVSFWFGLLAPLLLCVLMSVVLVFMVLRMRELRTPTEHGVTGGVRVGAER